VSIKVSFLSGISIDQRRYCSAKTGIDEIWHGNHQFTVDDASNPDLIDKVISGLSDSMDISRLPGIVNIPSCSWLDIQNNWEKGITDDNRGSYPCTPI
jgi:hypothetical protein